MITIGISKWPTEKGPDVGNKSLEAAGAIANGLMIYNTIPGFQYSLRVASGAATTMKMMGFE